jgi:hypothetical protein
LVYPKHIQTPLYTLTKINHRKITRRTNNRVLLKSKSNNPNIIKSLKQLKDGILNIFNEISTGDKNEYIKIIGRRSEKTTKTKYKFEFRQSFINIKTISKKSRCEKSKRICSSRFENVDPIFTK